MAKAISEDIREEVFKIVKSFNEEHKTSFQISFRGKFAYLSKIDKQAVNISNTFKEMIATRMGLSLDKMKDNDVPIVETKLGRLKYQGKIDDWSFAVFKYSRETYDSEEFMFPGSSKLNGTIEGALRAGIELYP